MLDDLLGFLFFLFWGRAALGSGAEVTTDASDMLGVLDASVSWLKTKVNTIDTVMRKFSPSI